MFKSRDNIDISKLKELLNDIKPIYFMVNWLPITENYNYCLECLGIFYKNRSCACGLGWKYWENNIGKILRSISPYWIESQYQDPHMKRRIKSRLVDYVGRVRDLKHLNDPLILAVEIMEKHHFSGKRNLRVFDMTIDDFVKTIFFWKAQIPLLFINVHQFVDKKNIKKKTMDDSEIRNIARYILEFLKKVNVYNSLPNGENKKNYYIKNFVMLPSTHIRLKPKCEIGHEEMLVLECLNLIEHANSNTLSDYFKNTF